MNIHPDESLERTLVIRTPENLELTYELAGAGTRSAAYVIDMLFQWLFMGIFGNLIVPIAVAFGPDNAPYAMAVLGLVAFTVSYGYFVVFEWAWSGQTPGKKVLGIRVVKRGGYALTFIDTLLRNLLRVIDFFPVMYGVGLTSVLLTRNSQRLGDLLAGTLVVYQNVQTSSQTLAKYTSSISDNPTPFQVASIPSDILESCDEYFRISDEIAPRFRQELTGNLIQLIERTTNITPDPTQSDEAFLATVIHRSSQIHLETS